MAGIVFARVLDPSARPSQHDINHPVSAFGACCCSIRLSSSMHFGESQDGHECGLCAVDRLLDHLLSADGVGITFSLVCGSEDPSVLRVEAHLSFVAGASRVPGCSLALVHKAPANLCSL